ncbi:DnaJ homolog subfamily C member 7 [Fistulifera solaris]|uniref:DnaJ homolog subfamily C member 7 n=1 Tax=Fistulifera solaris TaxID=1519565 RepID=A0A1Z5K8T5_FISSO|nr:DnaJ homolog subfamily C member 7 [Fistulifera solaris]|eukprot:GAX22669.1 DnaJ homolog subfamily C member 7 [Fistulifera solaris]
MGFELQHVISDEHHYGVFECVICQQLIDLDALVTTPCSHAFCEICLRQWLSKSTECPTCHQNLLFSNNNRHKCMTIGGVSVSVEPLSLNQPMAHRSLKRVQVSCPFSQIGCDWKGDYGDLDSHLSKAAHQLTAEDDSTQRTKQTAVMYKEEANNKFASRHFRQAQDMYTKAIDMLQVLGQNDEEVKLLLASLYANRSATHLILHEFSVAVHDATCATEIDPFYVKAYSRKAKALLQLGSMQEAFRVLQQATSVVKGEQYDKLLAKELEQVTVLNQVFIEGSAQLGNNEFAAAKSSFSLLLSLSQDWLSQTLEAPNVLLGLAKADLGLGLTDATLRLTLQVLKKHPQSTDAYALRGQCYLLMTEYDASISLLKEALRRDPDSVLLRKTLKESLSIQSLANHIKEALFYRRFEEAKQKATEAIQACALLPPKSQLHAWLYTQRATAFLRLKEYQNALKDCATILYYLEDYVEAWLVRFQVLHALERHEEVVELSTDLLQKWGANDSRIRKAYETADFEVRKRKRPDFYAMLGVTSLASEREMKKAYRQKAMELHPDRMVGQSEELQRSGQLAFQLLGEGLEILTDDFKRRLYDEGYDTEAIKERVEAAKRAAHGRQSHNH